VVVYGFNQGAEHEVTSEERIQAQDDGRLLEQITEMETASPAAQEGEFETVGRLAATSPAKEELA
jgi:hypothetical protein